MSTAKPRAKTVRCLDIGLKCLFQARGESAAGLLEQMRRHLREAHDGMTVVPTTERLIKRAIKDDRWGRFAP
ncbi:MAG: DUF1059 domain-containing protein [Chloroflexi bacterium]|nr:DUF1059 domain-containing protein [Chloroflexota bacterium]